MGADVDMWSNNSDTARKGSVSALANPNKSNLNPRIISSIISKKKIRERPIRVKSVISVFLFLICVHAAGWGHNDNTEKIYYQ